MNEKLYTLQEIAEYFRVKPRTVLNWEKKGEIAFVRIGSGNLIRITQKEFDRFIDAQTVRG